MFVLVCPSRYLLLFWTALYPCLGLLCILVWTALWFGLLCILFLYDVCYKYFAASTIKFNSVLTVLFLLLVLLNSTLYSLNKTFTNIFVLTWFVAGDAVL